MKFYENGDALTEPFGFFCSGVHCDVKGSRNGKLDLGIIFSHKSCNAAGVFTTNDVQAAPVRYSKIYYRKKTQLFVRLLPIAGMQMLAPASRVRPIQKKWHRKCLGI